MLTRRFSPSPPPPSTSTSTSNSAGETDRGSPADTVEVRLTDLADADGFAVEDDGPGIDPQVREAVFERGFTTDDEGTGFGLAIVSQIAEAHGWGVVATESERGGARFEISVTT